MGIIYKFTNLINNKSYIGQTINPQQRYNAHKNAMTNTNSQEYDSILHRAFRKYGFENFEYSILAETDDIGALNLLEIYFIKQFNSKLPNGYNIEEGGKNGTHSCPEELKYQLIWDQAKLTEEEVKELREAYKNKESPTLIYRQKYKDRLHLQSFMNIWTGKRYGQIMPEVFEQKNRHTKLTEEIVKEIRKVRENEKLSYEKLSQRFNISKATIADIVKNRTWKNV